MCWARHCQASCPVRGQVLLVVKVKHYRISSVIIFSFQNNPKDLDPYCTMDPDLCDYLGRVKLVL